MTGRLDEEKTAMDAGVLNVAFSLSSELFSEVGRVLVFDVLDNGIPAPTCQQVHVGTGGLVLPSIVVYLIAVAWCVHNVQAQAHSILLNDCKSLSISIFSKIGCHHTM